MDRQLKVLLIEDSEDDATLILHELAHGGIDVDHERVFTTGAVRDALARREWDLILADHAMPGTCSLEALTICKESKVEAPFIIVSGWMTEELAESAVKEGARGFVPKNRLALLVPMVKKELARSGTAKRPAKKAKKSR